MTTLQSSTLVCSSASREIRATLQAPKLRHLSMPSLPMRDFLVEELNRRSVDTQPLPQIEMKLKLLLLTSTENDGTSSSTVISELYAHHGEFCDRVEMQHQKSGIRRDNWNPTSFSHPLMQSRVAAATMAASQQAVEWVSTPGPQLALIYLKTTKCLREVVQALHGRFKLRLPPLRTPTPMALKDAMAKVLALDKAYPLPLLGTCLTNSLQRKAAVWWPKLREPAEPEGLGGKTREMGGVESLKRK
ncbi:hypothetical protein HHK36_002103 [Tetracentron sinense]|uniref:Uncharacterized protein n=1 Tax=Tetracentron sinense TaxID=13715 RepID=A0A834ZTX2_TETSI|nr:hypothetical protein HHK36_002103 [Tetracentron sinense]